MEGLKKLILWVVGTKAMEVYKLRSDLGKALMREDYKEAYLIQEKIIEQSC